MRRRMLTLFRWICLLSIGGTKGRYIECHFSVTANAAMLISFHFAEESHSLMLGICLSFVLRLNYPSCPLLLLLLLIIPNALRTNWLLPSSSQSRPSPSSGTPDWVRFIRPMISTVGYPPRRSDCCGLRTPWPPGRWVPSTVPRCARARPRCDRTDRGRAAGRDSE